MRIGVNPEKLKPKRLNHKPHRVIMPVYIPNLEEEYFKNALDVLKLCLDSLLATTNPEQTNITVINNASCGEVDEYLERLFQEGKIDKYVKRRENRGKVEPVLSEAMGSYEDYITITDADVFFKEGWLFETMKIFKNYQPGVVMPLPVPNNYKMNNIFCLNRAFFSKKMKYGKIVDKNDLIEFERSVGSSGLMNRFYDRQFHFEKNGVYACLGAGHFVATYDRQLFDFVDRLKKVKYIFKNGQEREYIDNLTNLTGTCRLSTIKSYVYHMGNTIPDFPFNNVNKLKKSKTIDFPDMPKRMLRSNLDLFINKIIHKLHLMTLNINPNR